MSSKPKKNRTKQYLMLLTVAGLIAIVGGAGSGTFASFNAEVSNTGNYFATGTLVLNDNGGTTTCTSAADSGNQNNLSTNGCDTLFQVGPVTSVTGTLSTALVSPSPNTTSLVFSGGLTGGSIDAGDDLVVSDGAGHTQTFTATAGADPAGTSVTVTSVAATFAFPIGSTITDATSTQYAKLTLTNAGTLDADGIKFDVPSACATTFNEGESAGLTTALVSGASVGSLDFAALTGGGYAIGDPIVVTDGAGHSQTFIASSAAAEGDATVDVQAQDANFSYPAGGSPATVSGPEFTPAGELCTDLKLSVVETDSSFNHSSGTAAEGCAYGTAGGSAGLGCIIGSGTALASVPSSPTALTLASGINSNTGTNLSSGKSRYFLVAVKQTSTSLDNTYQNRKATFDLLWHLDQA
jgi:predicted ribosomally synthesized peptide with SipW-like signal peptide